MRTLIVWAGLVGLSTLVSACNTFEGVGQDMKVGGEKLERSADDNKGPDSERYGD